MDTIIEKILKCYLLIFGSIIFIYILTYEPPIMGEWDDYSLVTVSIINEQNISISPSDIEKAKELFPTWKESIDNYLLSPYTTKAGGEMAWYFCTYSAACVPMVLLLQFLKLPAMYAFSITNLFIFLVALYISFKRSKINSKNKLLLMFALTLNPIIFYMPWTSAEVFLYSMLVLGMMFWTNSEYKKAAIFISIASTLNPTILAVGVVMIIQYLYKVLSNNKINSIKGVIPCFLSKWKDIVAYGSCYIIALIPFAYNYYNIGHINLTASLTEFTESSTHTWERFLAYLFDLNFGILPYYNILFFVSLFLLVIAIYRRKGQYILIMVSFFSTVYLYSCMSHINSGMSGIARYNAWSAVIMVFAVIVYHDKILKNKKVKNIGYILILFTCFLSSIIIYNYGPMLSSNYPYTTMSPIASYVLDNYPNMYNPLGSTFNSRINHVDGGYSYELPIYYSDKDGNIRKILTSPETAEIVKEQLGGKEEDIRWLNSQLEDVHNEQYISIGKKRTIIKCPNYKVGDTILFSGNKWNADKYTLKGISKNEQRYTWTDGKEVDIMFKIEDYDLTKNYMMNMEIAGVFNSVQNIEIFVNDQKVLNQIIKSKGTVKFELKPTKEGIVSINIILPDAISPTALEISDDERMLGLMLVSANIKETNKE